MILEVQLINHLTSVLERLLREFLFGEVFNVFEDVLASLL